ncbi:MarR family winged helix-turn-helix transcriptional regulator [Actinoplanes missouriensis]|uniref:MarR family winged helix-turn-helix transcriptional regulator n=1 Tax=Actinoplanes missouriensis TaxID=1866 RepID=UPI0034094D9C
MDGAVPEIGTRLHDLIRVSRMLKQRRSAERSAIPIGLFVLLAEIDRLPTGSHARELAIQSGLDPSTVSRAVAALVSHGLVAREPDPHDGRATVLVVTVTGKAALAETLQWYERTLARALAGWSPEELAAFSHGLGRFTEAIDTALSTNDTLMEAAQ